MNSLFSTSLLCVILAILIATIASAPSTCAPCIGSTTMCCSKWGYCGSGPAWCGDGCQAGACTGSIAGSTPRTTPPATAPPQQQGTRLPTRAVQPQTPPAQGGGSTLTAAKLQQIMGTASDLSGYLPYIQTALNTYNMNTPLRIAAFLAQVRHETAGLTIFYQPADGGAGAIHMLPQNFRIACRGIPSLSQAFAAQFSSCSSSNKCDCGDDTTAGRIVARNEYTFLTGGWWFAQGSREIMGWTSCGDLRLNADQGLGSPGSPGSGYYEISRCIFGNGPDGGLNQRLSYYRLALQVMAPGSPVAVQTPPPPAPGGGMCNPPCASGMCCSQYGYCGTGPEYCGGKAAPQPGGRIPCNPPCASGLCCSQYGYCGTGPQYCS